MRVVAVVTLQAKPRTCCGAFTLFQMYRRGKSAGLTPAAVSMLGLGLSVFKGLRQADQHSAHERGIICVSVCMTFNPASRDERMAACASRACALSVSFTCAPVSVPPRGMLSRMDFHCSLVRSLASWAACLTPERHQPDMYACARVMGAYISNRNVCS